MNYIKIGDNIIIKRDYIHDSIYYAELKELHIQSIIDNVINIIYFDIEQDQADKFFADLLTVHSYYSHLGQTLLNE